MSSEEVAQQLPSACIGGQRTVPYEQNTQQSPAFGLITDRQLSHWWKNTQASVGIDNVRVTPQ